MSDRTLLDRILEPGSLSVLFQPILDVGQPHACVHAFEGLVRGPRDTTVERADLLFEYVRLKGEEPAVDQACLASILGAAHALGGAVRLGINVHASTLARDPEFGDVLGDLSAAHSISPSRLIIEIVEHAPLFDVPSFQSALDRLRRLGAQIALDDVGLGQSNFGMILECRPDSFKIDRHIVRNSSFDVHRQAVLESVSQLARRFGARVVAEGVETRADLAAVRAAGIDLIQGHLFFPALPVSELVERHLVDPDSLESSLAASPTHPPMSNREVTR